jgi:hypothetical protein
MGLTQRVIKLNLLSSDNPGLIDGVSFIVFIKSKIMMFLFKKIMYGIIIGKVEMRTFEGSMKL